MLSKGPQRFKSQVIASLNFLSWSFLFAIIYAQSPLYTSNQNQYFLHGLAQAGYGYLHEDWLANTLDPTPVFSLLVEWAYRVFQTELVYYAVFALLLGLYLWSVLGIVDQLFKIRDSQAKLLIFLVLFLAIHSAAARYLLSQILGPDWTYFFEGGVAGQRLLGTVLQPSSFGVLLVLSLCLFLNRRTCLALSAMAIAVYFHPTYLLSAAMLTIAYMGVEFQEQRNLRSPFLIGTFSLLLVLPVLIFVYLSFGGASPEIVPRAREILVEIRIPHHAVIREWFNASVVFQMGLVAAALWLIRKSKLFLILMSITLMGAVLTGLQAIIQDDGLALLFPWRISVLIIPLSSSICLGKLTSIIRKKIALHSKGLENGIVIASMGGIILLALTGIIRISLDLERKNNSGEVAMMTFVKESTASGDVYLMPSKLQDFRLETGAPVYVDFKSIPYAPEEVLEWRRRVLKAGRFYREKAEACETLDSLVDEGVTHVVLESDDSISACGRLKEIYSDHIYAVYIIRSNS